MDSYEVHVIGVDACGPQVVNGYGEPVRCDSCAKECEGHLYKVVVQRKQFLAGIRVELQSPDPHLLCGECLLAVINETFRLETVEAGVTLETMRLSAVGQEGLPGPAGFAPACWSTPAGPDAFSISFVKGR